MLRLRLLTKEQIKVLEAAAKVKAGIDKFVDAGLVREPAIVAELEQADQELRQAIVMLAFKRNG